MSATKLTTTLEKLYKLHKSLFDLSVNKTDVIKQGDISELDRVLKDEQKHLAAINTMEAERQRESSNYLQSRRGNFNEAPTISQCIEHSSPQEQEALAHWQQKLVGIIGELKDQNELNQKLVYQSLQFVNMNLSMTQPQPEQSTYSRPNGEKKAPASRSIFDSKA
ncbi:flagellar protein FlgN [Rossellomorea vietnamensis]|uniref:Flagellar protein FlgN n=1 Tax=Rossellomorea vietnamensis TaxID=218284 RepID=A0A6I6UJS3_9BACI|nr:flagellar protein FlgN [Rossellomorea vietnamensis]QHE63204.1 flagellar protein FlgN [Rossellomorea vietnamensis]